jgi:hypothetical protein
MFLIRTIDGPHMREGSLHHGDDIAAEIGLIVVVIAAHHLSKNLTQPRPVA